MVGPLTGYKIIELRGIGPGPYAGQLLADLGAEVIYVERPTTAKNPSAMTSGVESRGKKSVVIDLRKPGASEVVLKMVADADALIEGNRPGVTERLGVGPIDCHRVNPKLVYGRMTGWGQTGPWAKMAGHDINYISITGALNAMGKAGECPAPPINLVGDYGGGSLFLVMGILAALLNAEKTGKGEVIDAAIIDGTSSLAGVLYTQSGLGKWTTNRQDNKLDGGKPYYRCYKTSDDKFVAVGCLEPQFFALMLETLQIDKDDFGDQHDISEHQNQHSKLETIFSSKTRMEWAELFDGLDACVTPVLDYEEATEHPQNKARGGLKKQGAFIHPRTAPEFESFSNKQDFSIAIKGQDTRTVLAKIGFSENEIDELVLKKVVYASN